MTSNSVPIGVTTTTTLACTSARCLLDVARTQGSRAGQTIPAPINAKIGKGLQKLDAAEGATPKKARSLTSSARSLLLKAGRAAIHAGKGRRPRLSAEWAQALPTTCRNVAG